jgi:serine palmitoyltransferase
LNFFFTFNIGSLEICEHQRLSGQGYTYSASLPAMLAVSSLEALSILRKEPELLLRLRENTKLFWSILTKSASSMFEFSGGNSDDSIAVPVIFITLKKRLANRDEEDMVLQEVVDMVLSHLFIGKNEGV